MNLSTYFLCYWLFSSALTTLLDRFYITRHRLLTHICLWLLFSVLSAIVLLMLSEGIAQKTGLLIMATWLVIYGLTLARRLVLAYRRAVKISTTLIPTTSGPTYAGSPSSPIGPSCLALAAACSRSCPTIHLCVDTSSIPFYIYLFHCYHNYMLFYEKVENVMESEIASEDDILCDADAGEICSDDLPTCHTDIADNIKKWIEMKAISYRDLR